MVPLTEAYGEYMTSRAFANVAWIFGLHDRAWQETDVAGKTRPMTRSGLESKLGKRRMQAWIDQVESAHGPLQGD